MIGFLSGNLHRKDEHRAVIDVNGVGYEVFLAKDTLYQLGETGSSVRFEIYTHVNENAFHL
ncbi:MAG TPA: OB-fold domain-containing protein, partial [bacterium]|nr:OB-fold domain-containing protein [bacterium]